MTKNNLKKMLNNNTTQHKVFRSDEIIKLILNNLGVTRTDTSGFSTPIMIKI